MFLTSSAQAQHKPEQTNASTSTEAEDAVTLLTVHPINRSHPRTTPATTKPTHVSAAVHVQPAVNRTSPAVAAVQPASLSRPAPAFLPPTPISAPTPIVSPSPVVAPLPVAPSTVPAPAARVERTIELKSDKGAQFRPSAITVIGENIYGLGTQSIWIAERQANKLTHGAPVVAPEELVFKRFAPPNQSVGTIPVQEFLNFAWVPARQSIAVMDKSGDMFEFKIANRSWHVFRPNFPVGSPDPEYIDIAVSGKNVLLLDPERNQVWRYPSSAHHNRYFPEIMPWRLKPGDHSVADGMSIAYDGQTWVLRRNGNISCYATTGDVGMARRLPFRYQVPAKIRPSRLWTAEKLPLFVVERDNNRVLTIDKKTGAVKQFLFDQGSDLRGLRGEADGFWIVNGSHLNYRSFHETANDKMSVTPRPLDDRLLGLTMPIRGASMPRHPGVWPGARRLYRHGIHKGTDFFHDPGSGSLVKMGSPAFAADSGKVIRADENYSDMTSSKYHQVISECYHQHISSESNEDLLRGCQVWIDHGNGLITKYAHLDRIKPGLKTGAKVSRGDLVGFVGVSGTGQNLPGCSKHPHLHFEIWLDGNYIGWGLTPSETIGIYENIFGSGIHKTTARHGVNSKHDPPKH